MRLNNTLIQYLSRRVAERLSRSGAVEADPERIEKIVYKVITANLEKERQIEEEAHRLLRQHIREIEREGISYQKMFQLVKQKLAKERGFKL